MYLLVNLTCFVIALGCPLITLNAATVPGELESTSFAGTDIVPSPACLCAAPTGEVFVGVDLNGSLGKHPGKGRVVRLIDSDHDGIADRHTIYAEVDNPRGLISVGKDLFVLHTVIPKDTGILSGMHLSVFQDNDWNGKADGPGKRLVSNVSTVKHNRARGADHTTNGIVLGIDGWIYIAVGDFGFVDAVGSDGTTLTMLGGGIVRVRPDGTEIETYTHGTRNIYDVAIDPFMNIFTRGNTNDGGGWNVRFIHHVQSGEYGYPVLFKNFTGEMLPALEDLGGGSGTGALFLAEPNWPSSYTNVPLMADWGRSQLILHRLSKDDASFTQKPEEFIRSSQIADLDVDGSGRLYLAAWDGAGYKGSDEKGYVDRVVPKYWRYQAFPDLERQSTPQLITLLESPSAVKRLHTQQTLLRRRAEPAPLLDLSRNASASLESRVAALYTARQLGASSKDILALAENPALHEFALRAAADRLSQAADVPIAPFVEALKASDPRVRVAAAIGLGRLKDVNAADALLTVANPPAGTYAPQPATAKVAPPAFMSKKLKPFQAQRITVDTEGWRELHLVVTDGGDGRGHDHVGWFEPTLIMADGTKKHLTDLKWTSADQGWGKTLIDRDCTGQSLAPIKGKACEFGIGTHAPSHITYHLPEGVVQLKAYIGATQGANAGRGLVEYVVDSKNPTFTKKIEGPHASPNAAIVLPHVAIQSLVKLQARDASLNALDTENRPAALWALKHFHDAATVDYLRGKVSSEMDEQNRAELHALLARLYQREAPYDGSWWWGTRPETRGPYYKLAKWERSDAIARSLQEEYANGSSSAKQQLEFWNEKLRLGFENMINQSSKAKDADKESKVDLSKIANKAGEVGNTSIEDIILSLDTLQGDLVRGELLFTQQGCTACHTLTSDQPQKGPFMGQVGAILTREQIAESILKPNASISQGFATVEIDISGGKTLVGFVSEETADSLELRDITGNVTKLKSDAIKSRKELALSMMPPALANALSLQDFASLVDFLASRKEG
jgi:putative heme-binding domain-containing protein